MSARDAFRARADKQILVFDGGYGTAIQGYKLTEADYRGNLELTHQYLQCNPDQHGRLWLRTSGAGTEP